MSAPENPLVERLRRRRWIRRGNLWPALLALVGVLAAILPFGVWFAVMAIGLQFAFMVFPWEYPRPGRRSLGGSHIAKRRTRRARPRTQ